MSDYIKQLEQQNEELKEKLADKEMIIEDLEERLTSAEEDIRYLRETIDEVQSKRTFSTSDWA